MSQYDFGTIDPATKSGDQLATDLNNWRTALNSLHKGATRPTYAQAGTVWIDDHASPWTVKIYSGSADVAIGTVDPTSGAFVATNSNKLGGYGLTAFATAVQGAKADAALPKTGGTMSGGLSFSSSAVAAATDLSKHIALWGTTYGFSITDLTLNIVTDPTGSVNVVSDSLKLNGKSTALADGSNASGTWPINITGNAATATTADNALGVGQTWQDVTAARSVETVYQNTTGRSIVVNATGFCGYGSLQVSSDASTWIGVGSFGASGDFNQGVSAVIPANWYYRKHFGSTPPTWVELR